MSSRINVETDKQNLANEFATYLESVYSGSENTVYAAMKRNFESDLAQYYADHIDDNISFLSLNLGPTASFLAQRVVLRRQSQK